VTALLVTSTANAAYASEDVAAEEVAQLVQEVAPDQGDLVTPASTSLEYVTDFASAPSDPAESVSIEGAGNGTLTVSLPTEVVVDDPVLADDGTVVYPAADGNVDVAVQFLEGDVVRLQTVIASRDSAHEFTYELGGGYFVAEAADGSLWAYRFDQAGDIDLYAIGDAWARDASGAAVQTYYKVNGDELVQVVVPTEATQYPVVADPTWQWYAAAYGAGFSKKETVAMLNLGGVAGMCGLLAKYPGIGTACGLVGAYWFTQAGLAANAKGCVFIAAVPAPLAMRWVSPQCK
jgi:hypothetical protein